jgi:CO/xanthine dehydrogenase Mo-binding subunit
VFGPQPSAQPHRCVVIERAIGVARLQDPPLLTGRGAFVGDIGFPRQLHMRVVRSPYANAVLRSVNVTTALAAPGIVAVWTAADIADLPPIDFRDPAAEALRVGVRWGIPEPLPGPTSPSDQRIANQRLPQAASGAGRRLLRRDLQPLRSAGFFLMLVWTAR